MSDEQKSQIKLLEDLNKKMDSLVALTAVQGKDRDNQIKILAGLEFTNLSISKFLGVPKGTVDTIRAKMKGGKK
jgi:hypothetical protein